jgi:hypothetical protein
LDHEKSTFEFSSIDDILKSFVEFLLIASILEAINFALVIAFKSLDGGLFPSGRDD